MSIETYRQPVFFNICGDDGGHALDDDAAAEADNNNRHNNVCDGQGDNRACAPIPCGRDVHFRFRG